MKKYAKMLALILALVMLTSAFAGCGNGQGGDGTTEKGPNQNGDATTDAKGSSDNETEEEWMPDIERKNYNTEFYLNILPDVNPPEFYWVKESSNNSLSDAIYKRQENVRDYLGVDVVLTVTDGENRYIEPFKNAVKNKDGSVDMLLSHVYYGIDGFITGNYLTDFQDIPELNLDADYWKYDVMEGISANGHFYLGFSDFNILYTHVITFNKELLSKYEDQLDESLYDMVENYRWTLDKFIWLASLVYIDETSDGKTGDDTFGFVSGMTIGYSGFLQGCNIQLVDMDEQGNYVASIYTETNKQKMSALVDKLYNLVRSNYALMPDKTPEPSIANGRALMQINGTYWLSGLLNYGVDFGILPYPMYDEAQKNVGYRHLQWGGYICVPSYLNNPTMAAETLEMLSYFSEDVNIAFYEKMLGKQVADVPNDRKMLNIVWDGVCSEIAQTYYSVIKDSSSYLYALEMLTREGTTYNLASYVATTQTSINRKLKKFFANVD